MILTQIIVPPLQMLNGVKTCLHEAVRPSADAEQVALPEKKIKNTNLIRLHAGGLHSCSRVGQTPVRHGHKKRQKTAHATN